MTVEQPYVGRFAPSPTGPLHYGSLYTALASFLQARSQQGLWLLRIDDLDTPRNIKGSADNILKTLEMFGLDWDGQVNYQSQNLDAYNDILDKLLANDLVYPCTCSRKSITDIYSGCCRNKRVPVSGPYALRIKTDSHDISFVDELQGSFTQDPATHHGDFILKRRDQIVAYQFAVVLDDHRQGVNHVVRGYDLLDSTPRQIYLQQILGLTTPAYMHVPVIVDDQGYKLSKQTRATAVDLDKPQEVIFDVLTLLKQAPPGDLKRASLSELLQWAICHWDPGALKNLQAICRKD